MITLYDYELSAHCYKVRLLLALLRLDYRSVPVEYFPGRAHKSEDFLAINPLGQLPVLRDDGFVLRESQAILTYLAARYDSPQSWYPRQDAHQLGEVVQWLGFADALAASAGQARLQALFRTGIDGDAARAAARPLLMILDEQLWFSERENHGWICTPPAPTLADIACFPMVMLSDQAGLTLLDYPALRRWTDRVKRLPGFVTMPGIFPASPGV